jgi:hypothetical protein
MISWFHKTVSAKVSTGAIASFCETLTRGTASDSGMRILDVEGSGGVECT